jgi:hypothetical protein
VTENQDTINFRNVGNISPKDTALHLRGLESSGEIIFWGHVRCAPRDGSDSVLCAMDIMCHCSVPWTLCAINMCHVHSVPLLCAINIVPLLCATDILYHC